MSLGNQRHSVSLSHSTRNKTLRRRERKIFFCERNRSGGNEFETEGAERCSNFEGDLVGDDTVEEKKKKSRKIELSRFLFF